MGGVTPRLKLRIDLRPAGSLGPGKVRLLELVEATGSISAAARSMGMSYRRAWLHIDSMNRCFQDPVTTSQMGGRRGGGASLTAFGRQVIRQYRDMEVKAQRALTAELSMLEDAAVAPIPADRDNHEVK